MGEGCIAGCAGKVWDLDRGDGFTDVYIHQTDHIAYLKYVQFISLQLYLSRVRGEMLHDIGNWEEKHDR